MLQGLDEHSKAALALIYMRNDFLESPIVLEESEREAIERLGSTVGGCVTALESLDESLVQYAHVDGVATWRFKHPTVGDAYAGLLLQSHELLGIYVHGSRVDKMMGQITCGDVGLERAVALPKSLYALVLKRLNGFSSTTQYKSSVLSSWYARRRVDDFLSSRCSKDFLIQYIDEHADVLDRVSEPGIFLNSVSEVDLVIRLHKLGLLPEKHRRAFVTTVISYALEGKDLYGLESLRIQSVFTPDELDDFRARIRAELVPNLGEVRLTWQNDRDSDQRAAEHMEPLLDSFSALKDEFAEDAAIASSIEREIKQAKEWIAEKTTDDPKEDRPPRVFGDVDASDHLPVQQRGIFDDVDE